MSDLFFLKRKTHVRVVRVRVRELEAAQNQIRSTAGQIRTDVFPDVIEETQNNAKSKVFRSKSGLTN